MYKFIFCCLFCIPLTIWGETISGNCVVLKQPFGDELFTISPGTRVTCSRVNKGWCLIKAALFVEKKYLYDGQQLLANARLKNEFGKVSGRSKIDFTPDETLAENDTAYLIQLSGYVESSCIEDTSIVELELQQFFLKQDSLTDIAVLQPHLKKFNYETWVSGNGFQSYLLKDIAFGNEPAGIRTMVVTENSKIVALIHGRPLTIKKHEAHVQQMGYSIYFLKGGNEAYKKKFSTVFQPELDKLYQR